MPVLHGIHKVCPPIGLPLPARHLQHTVPSAALAVRALPAQTRKAAEEYIASQSPQPMELLWGLAANNHKVGRAPQSCCLQVLQRWPGVLAEHATV